LKIEFINNSREDAGFYREIGIHNGLGRRITLRPGDKYVREIYDELDPYWQYQKIIFYNNYDLACQDIKLIKRKVYTSPKKPKVVVDIAVPDEYKQVFLCQTHTIKLDNDLYLLAVTNIPFEVNVPTDNWLVRYKKIGFEVRKTPLYYDNLGEPYEWELNGRVVFQDKRDVTELRDVGAIEEKEVKRFEQN